MQKETAKHFSLTKLLLLRLSIKASILIEDDADSQKFSDSSGQSRVHHCRPKNPPFFSVKFYLSLPSMCWTNTPQLGLVKNWHSFTTLAPQSLTHGASEALIRRRGSPLVVWAWRCFFIENLLWHMVSFWPTQRFELRAERERKLSLWLVATLHHPISDVWRLIDQSAAIVTQWQYGINHF